ncbi:MAG: fatty acid desaturase, partial [Candidatus Methylomirabilis oxyfera]|nr:fatty acid desaturase [Candidatus Methylomirabilis oxyfera]
MTLYDYKQKTPSTALEGAASSAPAQQENQDFSRREIKKLVQDLFAPKPALYWTDFLVTVSIGYGCAAIYLTAPAFSLLQVAAMLLSGLALFRAGIFIHELVHREEASMIGFHIAWNLLVGMPLLMHSFLYRNHLDHHHPRKFGTPADGEYLPLASAPLRETALYFAQVPVLPIMAAFRFLILVPLSLLNPRWRRWLLECRSSYAIDPYYRRTIPSTERQDLWVVLDLLGFFWVVGTLTLILSGVSTWRTIGLLYCLAIGTIGLNGIRTLAAHRLMNEGGNMPYEEQVED